MENENQDIYHHKVSLAWRKRIGNGYTNITKGTEERPYEFVSRAKNLDDMNRNPHLIMQMMTHNGLANKKVYDFHVVEVFESKLLGKSFHYEEKDYNKEYNK